jgi:7-carboxy-7-deazaguanine synthase
MAIEAILQKVAEYGVHNVCVTGGEPLAQKRALRLLTRLCDEGYEVSLETSGALDVSDVDLRVIKVMDLKTPGSGETERNRYGNLAYLRRLDQVKFVIRDRSDYDWSKTVMQQHGLADKCEILFSPAYGVLEPRLLAEWVIQDRLPVRFQIQLHKILWGDEPGR